MEGKQLVAYNYLANTVSDALSVPDRTVLLAAERWTPSSRLAASVNNGARVVRRLIRSGCLVVEGTERAAEDEQFANDWEWDLRAGLFHLAIKDQGAMSEEREHEVLAERIGSRAAIPLYRTNEDLDEVIPLRRPDTRTGTFATLAKRRTRRSFDKRPIPLPALGDCLYAGLGITGFYVDTVPGYGKLPLKMTPSGGARNPYEAYVYAQNVEGLTPGFYHYSAMEHSLGVVAPLPLPPPSKFLGPQDWYDRAAAVVFLVAHFARPMWKYGHPMVYRAVLIEAGHIGQNIMVAAADRGLSTSPTALFADRPLEAILGLNHVMDSVVYVIGLGRTSKRQPDWGRYEKHPRSSAAINQRDDTLLDE